MPTAKVAHPTLARTFPNAPYGFFGMPEYAAIRDDFIQGRIIEPNFTGVKALRSSNMRRRLERLQAAAKLADDADSRAFIDRRLAETTLLLALTELREQPKRAEYLTQYRSTMAKLYGTFSPDVYAGVLGYVYNRAVKTGQQTRFIELFGPPDPQAPELYRPSERTFSHYRYILLTHDHLFNALLKWPLPTPLTKEAVDTYFTWALAESGAAAAGWTVKANPYGNANVMISRHRKTVLVGTHFFPHTKRRLRQVVAHEVLVHVCRTLHATKHMAAYNEEGVAIVIEQLLSSVFIYRRMLRYLAAALAWGVDGTPRTFRQTYDILWGVFMIVGNYSEAHAKQRAFAECARIFRGGVPEVAGAAYIKDKVYLEMNLATWQHLEKTYLSSDEFLRVIYGQDEL